MVSLEQRIGGGDEVLADESAGGVDPAGEVDGGEHRLEGIREDAGPIPAAAHLLAAGDVEERTQPQSQPPRRLRQ